MNVQSIDRFTSCYIRNRGIPISLYEGNTYGRRYLGFLAHGMNNGHIVRYDLELHLKDVSMKTMSTPAQRSESG